MKAMWEQFLVMREKYPYLKEAYDRAYEEYTFEGRKDFPRMVAPTEPLPHEMTEEELVALTLKESPYDHPTDTVDFDSPLPAKTFTENVKDFLNGH